MPGTPGFISHPLRCGEGEADVVPDNLEIWIREQVLDVMLRPVEKVIGADYLVPLFEKPFCEVEAY